MAIACTQAERDALAEAIKSGISRVAYADKTVTYESSAVMRSILAEMDEYLLGSSATTSYRRITFRRE